MRTLFLLVPLVLGGSLAAAEDTLPPAPVPAHEAVSKFKLPDGFRATLFAGEPDIVQPMSFTFDDRGRMWVVENFSYPKWSTDGTGKDRITILEDTDHDGVHDKKTIFYDQGCNLSGIEYGFGGVWLTAIPNLIFIPDKNSDDVPDGPPEIILDGWDMKARHNVVNSPAWGPDGWLYGLNGILSNSAVGKPGTPDAERVRMNCGVWRYHPTRKIVEAYAHGTTNPWGMDWDEYGQMMITNCVIKHLFHVVPGGHYDRMFGQDANPNSYHLMPSIADHLHWAGGHWTTSRGGHDEHDDAGGGHAHVGCMVYLGDNWPKEYRNNVFTLNVHGNRLNRDTLEFDGSTYVAKHAPDFLFANDPWFRGLVVKYGPDGGVYISDWTDTGECHNYEVADTTNGRIYKVVYGERKKLEAFDLAEKSGVELGELQFHENDWYVRHARRILQERTAATPPAAIDNTITDVLFREKAATTKVLRAVWALHALGKVDHASVTKWIRQSGDAQVQSWLIQLGCDLEVKDQAAADTFFVELAESLSLRKSPQTLLALASVAQRIANAGREKEAYAIVKNLVKEELPEDPYLHQMVWYAVESITDYYRNEIAQLLPQMTSPLVRESLSRRLTLLESTSILARINNRNEITIDGKPIVDQGEIAKVLRDKVQHEQKRRIFIVYAPSAARDTISKVTGAAKADGGITGISLAKSTGLEMLLGVLAESKPAEWQAHAVRGMVLALGGAARLPTPELWPTAATTLAALKSPAAKQDAQTLALIFSDANARAELLKQAANSQADQESRAHAIELLVTDRADALPPLLIKLLDDPAVRPAAIRGLAAFHHDGTPQALLQRYAKLTSAEKEDVVQTLSARADWANVLLDAVKAGTVPRQDVSSLVVRNLLTLKKDDLKTKITELWGEIKPASAQKKELAEKFKLQLTEDVIAKANVKTGHALFTKTCGSCHKLYGQGGAIGPELTGSQRGNLDYLLDNVLDPSAMVPREYAVQVFELASGRVVQGIVVEETNFGVTVQTPNERVSIPKDQIESRTSSNVSMMPEGLFDRLSPVELRDLVAYLKTKEPVK